ncbi:MAG: hypothetical protein EOM70_05245 [Clostridia bacterium]|nr:hypothetical protein [Clostridia bacterium]
MPPLAKNASEYARIIKVLAKYPFHGLDFKKIIDKKVWALMGQGSFDRLKSAYYNLYIRKRTLAKTDSESDLLFVRESYLRADHKRNYDKVIDLFAADQPSFLDMGFVEQRLTWRTLKQRSARALAIIRKIKASHQGSLGLVTTLALAAEILQIEDFYQLLATTLIRERVVVVFHDASSLQNLICQQLKGSGSKTITLQHGLYIEWAYPGIHVTDYENVSADYFLAWGPATKNLIEKYNPTCQVLSVGHPFFIGYQPKPHETQHRFGVILCALAFREDNRKLIALAEQISQAISVPYLVKLHPADNESFYQDVPHDHCQKFLDKSVTVMDYVDWVDFSITNPSSLLYQFLFMNHMTYKFGPAYVNDPSAEEWISVTDVDSFLEQYNRADQTANRQEIMDFVSQYFALGNISDHYYQSIQQILEASLAAT